MCPVVLMTSGEINILVNTVLLLISVPVSFFPVFWLRTHNSDYKSGFRLIMPTLGHVALGCFLFVVLYVMRLAEALTDAELQRFARFVLPLFLLSPVTLVLSLHYWQKDDG